MRTAKIFSVLGAICALGGFYFFLQLTNTPNVGEVIVLPIYIGFAVIGAGVCFAVALVMYLLRRRK